MDWSSEASSCRRSYIGLSEKQLLKCAFSIPQTEGATESPGIDGEIHFQIYATIYFKINVWCKISYQG